MLSCDPEHPGGLHLELAEAEVVKELFRNYSTGTTALSQLARWMNQKGFGTRNVHRRGDKDDDQATESRMFTAASVRGILHNPFYAGKVKHHKELFPGSHEALVSEDMFQSVQVAMKRNSGRSETLKPRLERDYLLKGLIKCARMDRVLAKIHLADEVNRIGQ